MRTYGDGTITTTDEEGRSTQQVMEAFGHPDDARVKELVDATTTHWRYEYSAIGALTKVTAPDGIERRWKYDALNRLEQEVHPESGTADFAYNATAKHLLTQRTDANGNVFVYNYDDNDRVTRVTAGTSITDTRYEAGSENVEWISNGSVATTFGYHPTGRVQSRQDVVGAYLFTSTYQYDADGNLIEVTYPSGRKISYAFSPQQQRITSVSEIEAGRDYAFGMTYHPSGGLASYTSGNLTSTVIERDSLRHRVESIASGPLQLAYTQYDGVGNPRVISDARPGFDQTFTYDWLDRLVSAVGPYGPAIYQYNVHGNRTNANGSTYQYDTNKLRLTSQNGMPFTYDDNGNLKTTSTATYDYTPQNWLRQAIVSGVSTNYVYDANGARTRKSTTGESTYYLRGLGSEVLTEWHLTGTSARTRDYVYAGSQLLSAVDHDANAFPTTCGGFAAPNGSPQTVTVPSGQTATISFEGSACRRVAIYGHNGTIAGQEWGCDVWVGLLKPDGTSLGSGACMEGDGFIDVLTLPVSGTYSVLVDPTGAASGSLTLNIYDVPPDVTASITAGGGPVTVQVTTPGQNAQLTFTGAAGQRVSLSATNASITGHIGWGCDVWVGIVKPDNTPLSGASACVEGGGFMEPVTLPSAGQYTIVLDPWTMAVGSMTLTLYNVPADFSGPITPGTALPLSITIPGTNASFTFNGTAGQRISLNGTGATITGHIGWGCDVWVGVTKPDGWQLTSTCMEGGGFIDATTLPTPGTYTVVVDPQTTATGGLTLTLYQVNDATGTLAINGGTVGVTISAPGQNAALTFSGTAGQQVTARFTGNTLLYPTISLLRPDGSTLYSMWSGSTNFNLPTQTLPTTGIYTVAIDPYVASTGNITVEVTSP